MKRIILPLLLAAGLALPAAADTMSVLYANTLKLTDQQGRTSIILLNQNGRLEQVNGAGMWAAGFWSYKEGNFCWTARGEQEICLPLASDKALGDTWDIKDAAGKKVWTASLAPGRPDLHARSGRAPAGHDDHAGHR